MVRKQLYVDEELNEGLRYLAARTGRSEAEHVREALHQYLQNAGPQGGTGDSDALLELIGLAGDVVGPVDAALRHDDYLYGAERPA